MNTRITLGPVLAALVMALFPVQDTDAQVEWTSNGVAVPPGPLGSWNEGRNILGDVVFDGTTYHMYLIGGTGINPNNQSWSVGHWTSNDIQGPWDPDPCNPVLEPEAGEWDAFSIKHIAVLYEGGIFKMWYGSSATQPDPDYVGYTSNVNGYCYWDNAGSPLPGLTPGAAGAWDENGVLPSSVLFDGTQYHMWFTTGSATAGEGSLGHATSMDGLEWTKDPIPVLQPNDAWESNALYAPEVVPISNALGMWYSGYLFEGSTHVGYAISPDGVSFGRWPDNPVVSPLPGIQLCDTFSVVLEGDTFHGWVGHSTDVVYVTSPFELLLFDGFESADTTIWGVVTP